MEENYRIQRHPGVGGPAVTVPPGWDLQFISHGVDGVDEWLVYDARSHTDPGPAPRRAAQPLPPDPGRPWLEAGRGDRKRDRLRRPHMPDGPRGPRGGL
jgi:hypothetical protein